MSEAQTVIEAMPSHFLPDKAQGVNAIVNYVLTGEGGGEWAMKIANGTCEVNPGKAGDAKVTITMDSNDFVQLSTGKVDAMKLFMMGKIKLAGDFGLASRVTSFFSQG